MFVLEPLCTMAAWAARNTAYNLDFIPDDRLNWKPADSANSALEIVQHVGLAIQSMHRVLDGGEWSPIPPPLPANREEAKQLLIESTDRYLERVRALTPEELSREVLIAGRFKFPLLRAATMPMVDLVHHHGQIAYLQTLLGDTDFHFMPDM